MGAALAANCPESQIHYDFGNSEHGLMSNLRPTSKSLRKYRFSEIGRAYLVTTSCRNRAPVFSDRTLGAIVAEEIRASDRKRRTYTFAYVVMPDHLHWLFELRPLQTLASVIRHVKGRSSYRVNQARHSSGAIWQSGYHDHAVRAEESLEILGNYVIHNPVRAGLVTSVEEYPLWDLMWNRG